MKRGFYFYLSCYSQFFIFMASIAMPIFSGMYTPGVSIFHLPWVHILIFSSRLNPVIFRKGSCSSRASGLKPIARLVTIPSYNQKLELSFSSLSEYRYGGEMVDDLAHLAKQSEERTHCVFMGGLDYQINFIDDNRSFILYMAGQLINREHPGPFTWDSGFIRFNCQGNQILNNLCILCD